MASETESNLAVMFADVSDSTRLYESLGDREALRLVGACLAAMRSAAEERGGRIVKTMGDELMVAYDDATIAAEAAVDMQNAISEHHKPLSIRVGYDVGPVIEEAGDLYGDTVNVASRMSQLAQPGQILATARALEFLPDHMKELARLLSGITVRGKTQVLNVGEIVWEFRDDVTMVGTGVEFGSDPDSAPVPTLRLRHSTGELVLVDGSEIKLGRSADCDILIVDPKASRMHASIERRRDKFVLIDRSANGTYVVLDDKREIHLKREEFTLSGGGVLGFGQSPRAPGADTVTFICE